MSFLRYFFCGLITGHKYEQFGCYESCAGCGHAIPETEYP